MKKFYNNIMKKKIKRVLLKISWEALKWEREFWIETSFVEDVVRKIKEVHDRWIDLAIVIWGGNIYRGSNLIASWVNPADSHNMSMLSTVFNGLVLKNFLEKVGIDSVVMNPLGINFLEKYRKENAKKCLEEKKIVICVWGTGNPYFTTDTAWVLRALELDCDMIVKATKVEGLYDKDPEKYSDASFIEKTSYKEVIQKNLKIMDQTAFSLAAWESLPIKLVNFNKEGAILRACLWEKEGSEIS